MASSAFTVKKAVFDLLNDLPSLAKSKVTYGHPNGDPERRTAMVLSITWDRSEWKTNKSREEDYTIRVRFLAFVLAGTALDSETEMQLMTQEFEDAVKASPNLGGIWNIVTTSCAPSELDSAPGEGGWVTMMDYELRVVARV